MIDRDLEEKNMLVELARQKAERNGTTLESEVQIWLAKYVNEPEKEPMDSISTLLRSAPRASVVRTENHPISKAGIADHSGGGTRSEAYRRLLGVMSNPSRRAS